MRVPCLSSPLCVCRVLCLCVVTAMYGFSPFLPCVRVVGGVCLSCIVWYVCALSSVLCRMYAALFVCVLLCLSSYVGCLLFAFIFCYLLTFSWCACCCLLCAVCCAVASPVCSLVCFCVLLCLSYTAVLGPLFHVGYRHGNRNTNSTSQAVCDAAIAPTTGFIRPHE